MSEGKTEEVWVDPAVPVTLRPLFHPEWPVPRISFCLGGGAVRLTYPGKMPSWWVRFLFRKFVGITWEEFQEFGETTTTSLAAMSGRLAVLEGTVAMLTEALWGRDNPTEKVEDYDGPEKH